MNKWELEFYGDHVIDSAFVDEANKRGRVPLFVRAERTERIIIYVDQEIGKHAAVAIVGMTIAAAHDYIKNIDPKELLLTSLLKGNSF